MVGVEGNDEAGRALGRVRKVVRNKGGVGGEEVLELGVKGGRASGKSERWRSRSYKGGCDQEGMWESC